MPAKRLFVIDAMAMAYRNFYAFGLGGRPLTNRDGLPTGALFGSALFATRLIESQKPDYFAFACDAQEPTFRHKLYPDYKAHRNDMPADLVAQMPYFLRLMAAFGAPVLRQAGFEADDLIGSLVHQYAGPDLTAYIVSGDKDFMQLVSDHVFVYIPKKGDEAQIVGSTQVREKFGVDPEQVIDCLTLIGDLSDNIPGVHGIGEKGAAKLIAEFGTLDKLFLNAIGITNKRQREALLNGRDAARLAKELVTIRTDCELNTSLEALSAEPAKLVATEALLDLYRELDFKALSQTVERALLAQGRIVAMSVPLAEGLGEAGGPLKAPPLLMAPPQAPRTVAADAVPGYRLVNTPAALDQLARLLAVAREIVFDTETTGLDLVQSQTIGISLSVTPGEAYYVPLLPGHLEGATPQQALAALTPSLTREGCIKIGHNLKFDLQMLTNLGLEVKGPFVDTMIVDWLLDSGSRQHGLDAACLRHLNYQKIPTSSLIGLKGERSMADAPLADLTRYACEDSDLTFQLYRHLMPRIAQAGLEHVLHTIEMPLVPVLSRMERTGMHLDDGLLAELSVKLGAEAKRLEAEVFAAAGAEINLNSPKQLSELLFEKLKVHEQLGIKTLKKTQTGYSTDESVLLRLMRHPVASLLLEYRAVTKLKGTYTDALPLAVNTASKRLHTSLHQTGTATGRLSSSEPNLQNIPVRTRLGRDVRRAFRPREANWVMISADYSQIELRLLAHLAQEDALKKAFLAGADVHTATASQLFGAPMAEVSTELRARAKAINFGIIYGMGARRLADETGVTLAEAAEFISRYFETYPGIRRFVDETLALARSTGEVRTLAGRRRLIDGLGDANRRQAALAENIAVNTRIQGSAADLIKLAMIAVARNLETSGTKARLLLQVHDELLIECPKDEAEAVMASVRASMEGAMTLSVPLEAQVSQGAHWLEAH